MSTALTERSPLPRRTINGWRKFKRLLEWLAYGVYDYGRLRAMKTAVLADTGGRPAARAAMLQLGMLGDYFLWCPYGRALAQHLLAQRLKPVLIVSAAYKAIAAGDFADCEIVPLDTRRWVRDLGYRGRKLRQLRGLGAGRTFHMGYPRFGIVDDAIVRAIGAPALGFAVAARQRSRTEVRAADQLFAELIPAIPGQHQTAYFARFLAAVGAALPEQGNATRSIPPLPERFLKRLPTPDQPYYVLAPGASHPGRRWPIERFAELAIRLRASRPEWWCVLIGTEAERLLATSIEHTLGGENVLNLSGATSAADIVALIAHAHMVLANDSAPPHIAAAFGTPSVALVGGGHYDQFLPYAENIPYIAMSPATAAQPMDCFGCDWNCIYRLRKEQCFPCVEAIPVEQAWQLVAQQLARPRVNRTHFPRAVSTPIHPRLS